MTLDLAAAIKAAQPGATIDVTGVAPGGALVITGKANLKVVGSAIFRTIEIVNCLGLDLSRLEVSFVPDAKTTNASNAVRISACTDVLLHDMVMKGLPAPAGTPGYLAEGTPQANGPIVGRPNGRALVIENGCKNITVEHNDIEGFFCGPVISGGDTISVSFNKITKVRTTGIRGGAQRLTIEGNQIVGANPYRYPGPTGIMTGDHSDKIHIWNNPGDPPMVGLRILRNYLDDADAFSPTVINVEDKGPGIDAQIDGNIAVTSNTKGIFLGVNVTGSVTNNDMVAPAGSKTAPTLIENTSKVMVKGNHLHDSSAKPFNRDQFPDNVWRPLYTQAQADVDAVRAKGLALTAAAGVRPFAAPAVADPDADLIASLRVDLLAAQQAHAAVASERDAAASQVTDLTSKLAAAEAVIETVRAAVTP